MQILGEATKEDLKNQLLNINLEDKNLYDEVYKNQDFIFQFSGSTAAGMVKGAYPQNFNDMISINCLSRPGAGFQFDSFVANQNGESKYPEFIAKFLKDTRGCILTQEEIMAVSSSCGISANYCRGLLKKLGKKDKRQQDIDAWNELVKKFEISFKEHGMSESEIKMVLDDFVTLSAYSFNRSHAAAYSYLAMETIYLSHYFKPYFYAANLTQQADKKDGLKESIASVLKKGFKVLPPDVNTSAPTFSARNGDLYFGLGEIKGIGEAPRDTIVKNRPYKNVKDFIMKNLNEKSINKRIVIALIGAGAFDSTFGEDERKKYINIANEFYEKKKTKKDPEKISEIWDAVENSHSIDIPTTNEEYIELETKYLGDNFFHGAFSPDMKDKIYKLKGMGRCVESFDELRRLDIETYCPVRIEKYRYHTQKNGEEMLFCDCSDMNGDKTSIPVFGSYFKHLKTNFFGEGFYLLRLFPKGDSIMFGSRNFVRSPDTIRSFMIRWKI